MPQTHTVFFQFEDSSLPPVTLQVFEGESLLDAAIRHDIELHHNCGGVCACTTCHVYIEAGMENLPEMTDREEDYIDRAINPRLESRLACQCEVHGPIKLTVPDQRVMIGH